VLERILAETREELGRRRLRRPLDGAALPREPRRGFRDALSHGGVAVIAEFKRRSPSAGTIGAEADLRATIEAYRRGGAAALSILTEGPNFGGSLEDLRAAREYSELPLLRKDFVVDVYQLYESITAGADAVLLIVAALQPDALRSLYERARELGLDVLVEVHDGPQLHAALELGAELIGINNRDLRDFSVDIARTEQLLEQIPAGVTVISESGITEPGQVRRLAERGVAGVLVGESLMRSGEPEAALRALLEGAGEL
jgi:indole-3-glycerol phosphate synthase